MTMSASAPGAIVPFRGYRPNIRAGVVEHVSTHRCRVISPATPARMFGLYPRKGTIAPGADADIVIYDPAATQTLSVATHHMNVDYSAYEGMEITGKVVTTVSRGRVVVADGEFRGSPGHGSFLPRDLNQYLA